MVQSNFAKPTTTPSMNSFWSNSIGFPELFFLCAIFGLLTYYVIYHLIFFLYLWYSNTASQISFTIPFFSQWFSTDNLNITLWKGTHHETLILLIVVFAGALGSCIHILTSMVTYFGFRQFERSWVPWYFLRVPIGSALALILYLVMRGGFLPTPTVSGDNSIGESNLGNLINPYTFAAAAAVTGMFSKQAVNKLSDMFNLFFQTKKEGVEKLPPPQKKPIQDESPAEKEMGVQGQKDWNP